MDISFGDSTSPTTSYLPGYLLGSNNTQPGLPMSKNWSSPIGSFQKSPYSRNPKSPPRSLGSSFASPSHQLSVREKHHYSSLRATPIISRTPKESIGAPPVESLYDSKYAAPSPTERTSDRTQMDCTSMFSPGSRSVQHTPSIGTPREVTFGSTTFACPSPINTPPSPAQVDPFYTQGESLSSGDILNECWVTVFGFPPPASSYILQQFSQYGNIIRKEVMTNKNWMHIQYQSKLQAKKALSKHGKVFGGNLMIAVIPCIETSLMECSGKENITDGNDMTITDISMKSVLSKTPSKAPIRPLTAAYQAASSSHQVEPLDGKTPQKSDTIMSKAMEYMFGW